MIMYLFPNIKQCWISFPQDLKAKCRSEVCVLWSRWWKRGRSKYLSSSPATWWLGHQVPSKDEHCRPMWGSVGVFSVPYSPAWWHHHLTGPAQSAVNINTNNITRSSHMADSDMSPKAKVTYDQHKFEVEFNVSEYLPEVRESHQV